jgi:molybdopterin converting factor small subunit
VARVTLLLFAAAREAAGTNRDTVEADTIGDVLAVARHRYGAGFASVLEGSRVWLDGDEPADGDATAVTDGAEVAVLPPVSGGSDEPINRDAAGGG